MISKVRARRPELDIIAGNVATGKGAMRLVEAGANIVKVGVGGGSVCSTRVVSGHGMPTLQSVLDVCKELSHLRLSGREEIFIIADGGARYPGDIVKYLAAGADAVMLGSLLAGTDEAPGARIVEQGLTYKTFRGMASLDAQNDKRSGRTPRVEGVSAKVPYRGPVIDTLNNLEAGIRSGFSYSGAHNLAEVRKLARFVVVSNNSLKESHPHHPYKL
jgi:IMP dehydrogenase